ncbi:MAG TPA: cysteine--tRNA ligase [Candidatus Kaiserbacteria bacterium]|nr:cysteine--tRNA ligase [Candidatus Kaiserbacteria bacterium]
MIWKIFSRKSHAVTSATSIFLTNSLTRKKERFVPIKPGIVTMYSCGPTVYSKVHIGNLRAYIFSDTLARVLKHAGYRVHRIMNITDVGHLTGDSDDGEDKIEIGAKREGVSAQEISERYTRLFLDDLVALNVDTHNITFPRATEYIKEQIELAHALEEKGFAYRIKDGLYFNTERFPSYGKLGGFSSASLKPGARVKINPEKHSPADFALWKKTPSGAKRLQEWNSPWGRGCPGWHLECSAMARTLLGVEIDIHTGGEDLAYTHHNAEIAQSEAVSGRTFAHYWLHNAYLTMNGEKASKSIGNVTYLSQIIEQDIHPLALRYFFLQAHYRTPLSFSWDALKASNEALERLWRTARRVADDSEMHGKPSKYQKSFIASMHDDLNTSHALGILWKAVKSEDVSPAQKWQILVDADALLGLSLTKPSTMQRNVPRDQLPKNILDIIKKRDIARDAKDFSTADALRTKLQNLGYEVKDGENGTIISRR